MKQKILYHLRSLNSIDVESVLLMFRNAFEVLSFTFDEFSIQEVEEWILELGNPKLNELWTRQKHMKYPGFIFYFAMWYFRDKVLQEKGYSRETLETHDGPPRGSARTYEMPDQISRELAVMSTFDSIAFLGSLIGAWMLSCPKVLIVSATNSMQTPQTNEIWIKTMFPGTFGTGESTDELELLYQLDYRLYYMFADFEARNTE